MLKKTFGFGKVDYWGHGRKDCQAEAEVELRDTENGPELSVSGTVWNPRRTDSYMGGQCLDSMAELPELKRDATFKEIHRLWKLYHLNGMHAGTPAQEEFVDAHFSKSGKPYDYVEACEALEEAGLLTDAGLIRNGKPYRYGTAWLYQPIPEGDLKKIRALLSGGAE